MSESSLEFRGPGPFSLAAMLTASAKALPSSVQMTLHAIVGDDPQPRAIHIQMTHHVASQLGHGLVAAALEVESKDA